MVGAKEISVNSAFAQILSELDASLRLKVKKSKIKNKKIYEIVSQKGMPRYICVIN